MHGMRSRTQGGVPRARPPTALLRRDLSRKKTATEAADATPESPNETPDNGTILTLGDLTDAYCSALEDDGKSETTIRSYKSDLALACGILGAGQVVGG